MLIETSDEAELKDELEELQNQALANNRYALSGCGVLLAATQREAATRIFQYVAQEDNKARAESTERVEEGEEKEEVLGAMEHELKVFRVSSPLKPEEASVLNLMASVLPGKKNHTKNTTILDSLQIIEHLNTYKQTTV